MLPSKILDDVKNIHFKAFSNTMGDTGVKASMVYVDLSTLPKTEGVRDYLGYYLDNHRYDDGELFDGAIVSDSLMMLGEQFTCTHSECFCKVINEVSINWILDYISKAYIDDLRRVSVNGRLSSAIQADLSDEVLKPLTFPENHGFSEAYDFSFTHIQEVSVSDEAERVLQANEVEEGKAESEEVNDDSDDAKGTSGTNGAEGVEGVEGASGED